MSVILGDYRRRCLRLCAFCHSAVFSGCCLTLITVMCVNHRRLSAASKMYDTCAESSVLGDEAMFVGILRM